MTLILHFLNESTMFLVVCIISASLLFQVDADSHESGLNGTRQSPINIKTTTITYQAAPPLEWGEGYKETPSLLTLVDTGHTLQLEGNFSVPPTISGGNLHYAYEFLQLHFHWADVDDKGSEHTINGESYPMEMHIVHSQSVSNDADQLVVVAYFFKISNEKNKALQKLVDVATAAAVQPNQPVKVELFALHELIPTCPYYYYTYPGSLTTPPYTESVTWIISSAILPISKAQMATFRKAAILDKGMLNNYRPIQKLYGRTVKYIAPSNLL